MDPRSLAALMLISGVECSLLFFVAGVGGRRASPPLYWAAGTARFSRSARMASRRVLVPAKSIERSSLKPARPQVVLSLRQAVSQRRDS